MAETKMMRLSQVARKLNVGITTITEHLGAKGFEVESKPNTRVTLEQFEMLAKEFEHSALEKKEASGLTIGTKVEENVVIDQEPSPASRRADEEELIIRNRFEPDITAPPETPEEEPKPATEKEDEVMRARLPGIKVVGKIDLDAPAKPAPKPKEKAPEPPKPKPAPSAAEKSEPKEPAPREPVEASAPPKAEAPEAKATPVAEPEPTPPVDEAKPKPAPEQPAPAEEKPVEAAKKPADKPAVAAKTPAAKPAADKPAAEKPADAEKPAEKTEEKVIEAKADQLKGLTVVGKIELPTERRRGGSAEDRGKRKRKRVRTNQTSGRTRVPTDDRDQRRGGGSPGGGRKRPSKAEPTDKEIQEQIKATLARLSSGGGSGRGGNRSKYRRSKRSAAAADREERAVREQEQAKVLNVTEFISANDLASLMDVSVNEVIATCMSLGMFVSINQRLDAEAITIISDEFGYEVDFNEEEESFELEEIEDDPEDQEPRAPIVTIMGHVDHGKTSLLDYIRSTKVTDQEAGGITQHIGAYSVTTQGGKEVTFLDTPGHEAFTAMRARGAKVTDVAIIVVAADDSVMPQTKEALNHAQMANVPIVIAINKIDKPGADPEKIKKDLASNNVLVEDWGGKYQSQEVSAKTGQGIPELLEKVLLEAELLDLQANPDRRAAGVVVEASLDKGRGYVATILVQTGTLQIGDVLLAGPHFGRVKAMFDDLGERVDEAGPARPVQVLGLNGAPQAGDAVRVMENEREARDIATKREQILREQTMRTKKHITLDEIGRRLAIGNFKELNVIVKGDVDGSIEALSDSLLKLSTDEVQVQIIHKAVGQISESDVLLASASDAVIIGFQVRPSGGARRLAEQEEIEIRHYSVIYDAINDVRDAMEGMLSPAIEEQIVGQVEVREVFKITKVGTIAGCYVTEGYVKRGSAARVVRDGIVVYTSKIDTLRRFKDDVTEVKSGYECGVSIDKFNDIKEGDVFEIFEQREVKRTL